MPKIFEYQCLECEAKKDEWFQILDLVGGLPSDKLDLECEICKKLTQHERVGFCNNPYRWHIFDSPYGDKSGG